MLAAIRSAARRESDRATVRPGLLARLENSRVLFIALVAATLIMPSDYASSKQGVKDGDLASPSAVAEKQSDLRSLRAQIETLRKEMTAAEGSRREARDQLQEAERAISATQRELHNLTTQIGKLQTQIKDLNTQSRALEHGLSTQLAQLEKLLYQQYLRGNPDPLRLFLNGENPNQLARDLHYLEAIGQARSQILLAIESTLQHKRALATDTRQQAEKLSAIEAQQQEEHARLLVQRQQRQAMLDEVSSQVATQRRAIGNLQRDEKRLAELVDRLSKIIASRAAEAREARREVQRQEKPRTSRTVPEGESAEPSAAPPEARTVDPAATTSTVSLARMKGQLRLPTRGTISNRFGTARQEGSTWKGLFIAARTGSEVSSIAGGRVVFAEWMRGFGNLLIVDHGSSYLSIYANNDALLKQVGDEVSTGQTIATVGNSGGNPESGLYFELRHQGKPLDPLAWVNPK